MIQNVLGSSLHFFSHHKSLFDNSFFGVSKYHFSLVILNFLLKLGYPTKLIPTNIKVGQNLRLTSDCTPIYSRSLERKKFKHFVFNKYFFLVLGVLKSKISKKSFEPFLRKRDFKLFHYKARVQPVSKITTIATRNRC